MYPIVESICIVNKQLRNIELHNQRFENACRKLFGQINSKTPGQIISIPADISNERYKCRLTYDGENYDYNIQSYVQRKIETLKIVHDNNIDYSVKTSNRSNLDALFKKRGTCDDIIIIKNGLVTDTWAANIILLDGDEWITPSTPLLNGVQREYLLSTGQVHERIIREEDLKKYKKMKHINAMNDFAHAPEIETKTGIIS
jgi:4-amino-4-deoxychorismate lyase